MIRRSGNSRTRLLPGQAVRGADRVLARASSTRGIGGSLSRRFATSSANASRGHRRAPSLVDADRHGFTHDEYERLRGRAVSGSAPRAADQDGLGRLSRGIDSGWKHGFDSGVMLDYVYENRPQGLTPLGRPDRPLLSQQHRLARHPRPANDAGKTLRLLSNRLTPRAVRCDCSTSLPGRADYVLETMPRATHDSHLAVLRDYKQENLDAAARLLADELGGPGNDGPRATPSIGLGWRPSRRGPPSPLSLACMSCSRTTGRWCVRCEDWPTRSSRVGI